VGTGEFAERGGDTLKPEIFNTAAGAGRSRRLSLAAA